MRAGAPVGARKVRGGGRRVGLFDELAGGGICGAPVGARKVRRRAISDRFNTVLRCCTAFGISGIL